MFSLGGLCECVCAQMPVVTRSSRSAGSSLASRRRGCAVLEESDEENENNDDNSNNNTANKGNPDHQDNKVTNSAPESVPQFNGANNGEVTREAQAKPKGKAVKKRNQVCVSELICVQISNGLHKVSCLVSTWL